MERVGLRAGHVAAAAGVHLETLRYYERRGLLDEPERTSGGHRVYPESSVSRLRFIKAAQRLGFTLSEVADLLQACAPGPGARRDAALLARAETQIAEIEARITDLCAIRDTLRFGVAGGCDDPVTYLGSADFRLVNGSPVRPAPRASEHATTPTSGAPRMGTISTEDPVAIAVVSAIQNGDPTGLQQLLATHPDLARARLGDDDPDGMSRTLLHVVTDWPGHFPHGAATVALLVAAGADVHARFRGPHEETPLHWAASNDDVEVLDALLDAGADIEAPGAVIAGGTPLTDARAFKQWRAAHRLVERGATTTLADAAALGLTDRLDGHLSAAAAPTQKELDGAFWSACYGAQQAAAEALLARGANINAVPPWQPLTPLDAADGSDADDLVRWLRARGAKSATELAG